jgi:acetyltransferase-like isoleucine patch superfamily enzyme
MHFSTLWKKMRWIVKQSGELKMPIRDPISIQGDVKYGKNLDTGPFIVLRDCTIGDNVCIWSGSIIKPGAVIGNNVKISENVVVAQGVVVEDGAFIGPGAILLNDKYPPRYDPGLWQPAIIREGSIVGAGDVICPGVEIGVGAEAGSKTIIAAGAVVTRDVPAGQLWAGVPAERLR